MRYDYPERTFVSYGLMNIPYVPSHVMLIFFPTNQINSTPTAKVAFAHAKSGVNLLKNELFGAQNDTKVAKEGSNVKESIMNHPREDRIAVLVIAYHNLGTEQEFLSQKEASLQSFCKGVETANRYASVCES